MAKVTNYVILQKTPCSRENVIAPVQTCVRFQINTERKAVKISSGSVEAFAPMKVIVTVPLALPASNKARLIIADLP